MQIKIYEVRLYCRLDRESGDDRWFFELPKLGDLSDDEPYLTIDAAWKGAKAFITSKLELEPEVYADA